MLRKFNFPQCFMEKRLKSQLEVQYKQINQALNEMKWSTSTRLCPRISLRNFNSIQLLRILKWIEIVVFRIEFQRRRVRFTFYYLLRTFLHSLVDSLMNFYFTFVSLSRYLLFFLENEEYRNGSKFISNTETKYSEIYLHLYFNDIDWNIFVDNQ